jgi:hypothetical protein
VTGPPVAKAANFSRADQRATEATQQRVDELQQELDAVEQTLLAGRAADPEAWDAATERAPEIRQQLAALEPKFSRADTMNLEAEDGDGGRGVELVADTEAATQPAWPDGFNTPPADIGAKLRDALDYARFNYQDRFINAARIQEAIEKTGGAISDSENFYQSEAIYHGAAETAIRRSREELTIEPLLEALEAAEMTFEDAGKYAYARHAPERNEHMRKINPNAEEKRALKKEYQARRDALSTQPDIVRLKELRKNLRDTKAAIEEGNAEGGAAMALQDEIDGLLRRSEVAREYDEVLAFLRRISSVPAYEGDNTALSGMSNEDAAAILAEYQGRPGLDRVMEIHDAIVAADRELMVEHGLETPGRIESWKELYPHYASLKGAPEGQADKPSGGTGAGFNVTGKTKRATGRKSRVNYEDVLFNLLAQYESTIVRAHKADTGRALLYLVEKHPNPKVWEIDKPAFEPRIDSATGLVVYQPDPSYKLADNVVSVKVNGEDHHITLHGEKGAQLARAFKNLGSEESSWLLRNMSTVARYLSWINTGGDPQFFIPNFIRDFQTAFVNMTADELDQVKYAVMRDTPAAVKGILFSPINAEWGKDSEWAQHFREFEEDGGKTGWADAYTDIERVRKSLGVEITRRGRSNWNPAKHGRAMVELIDHVNMSIENGVRLSAYVHARRAGLSREKAAYLAKNLTVNFNRRGEKSRWFNTLFLFANATIQGNFNMLLRAAKSPKYRRMLVGVVVLAALWDVAMRLIGGEDEDEVPFYDKIPDYVKERNLVIMFPNEPGTAPEDIYYATIPVGYGLNVLTRMGNSLGQAFSRQAGWTTEGDAAKNTMDVVSTMLSAFNPLGSEGSLLQFVAPSVLDPLAMTSENKDWIGKNLMPESFEDIGLAKRPDSERYFQSVSEWAKATARWVNEKTGGTPVEPGKISVSPETLSLYVDTITGGLGRTLDMTWDAGWKLYQGEPIETRRIPFVRKVYANLGDTGVGDEFYENLAKIEYTKANMAYAEENRDPELRNRMLNERRPYLRAEDMADDIRKELRDIRKRREELDKRDLPREQKLERRKDLDSRASELMRRLNTRILEMQRQQEEQRPDISAVDPKAIKDSVALLKKMDKPHTANLLASLPARLPKRLQDEFQKALDAQPAQEV